MEGGRIAVHHGDLFAEVVTAGVVLVEDEVQVVAS